jgi:hypothetical protein
MLGRGEISWIIAAGLLAAALFFASKIFLGVRTALLYQCFELEIQRENLHRRPWSAKESRLSQDRKL